MTAAVLAGCGSTSSTPTSTGSTGSSSSPTSSASVGGPGLESVTITGPVGSSPTVKFTGATTNTATATKTLVTGKGAKLKQGDSLIVHTVIADGSTQKTVANSYTDHQPQVVALAKSVSSIFLDALVGQRVGSRVVIYTPASAVFGAQGNPQIGIKSTDNVLIVFDLVGQPVTQPDGAKHASPAWAPKIVKTKHLITGLDFTKTPKPDGKLRSVALRTGTGPKVKAGQTVFARYLGQVYKGSKPFDQNFDAQTPTPFQIGVGAVVSGWDKTLVGQHVGSEVVLAIPPKEGYGAKGQPTVGIKGTDTLYFVVDIVGAA
ncbi:FKBP-type peptidyl-prolyl cis-trans isomerase [Nocardioides cynanchi]|uniref:FKBP-type peptidyl-prolyl cis-trans isomerase n=1 Tax=Nocardioides cynanchi TaxID=2558918 RepID=UPI00177AD20E|nr:FKBP-type peptidyl-prolyl cis-trans isomerase [Nocardioides cynanchi]